MRASRTFIALAAFVVAGGIGFMQRGASAGPATDPGGKARCATRVKGSLTGTAATDVELQANDPQASVDEIVKSDAFIELFSRFLNAEMNPAPGMTSVEDSTYHLAKYVLKNDLPYKDLFVGKFDVSAPKDRPNEVTVAPDPMGLGYFRSRAWQVRYAGNESAGIKIVTAYRMMQNLTGLKLTAVQNADGVDISAAGRAAGVCAKCHYQDWSALDKVASILTVRKGAGDMMTFEPKTAAQIDVDGKMVTDDASLVARLVESENFSFNVCRMTFKFLYGRPENTCESKVFDTCIEQFKSSGKIQRAVAVVAKDPGFCQ
jgi:hypothetical protein